MSWATRYKASITNQNQGGGNKKEGLPPSVGTGSLSVWNGMGRAYGTPKDRALQVCINQLGSVNPRVYQSRYCGRIKSGGGELRDCDPRFTIDINQWTDDSTTTNSQYDVCFIMDRSGSMGGSGVTSWSLVRDFVDSFHDALLQRQKNTTTNKLPGDSTMAPATVTNALASNYNAANVAPKHRISFISFGTNSNYNITYNTYASQIFEPGESEVPGPSPRFNKTSDRFDAILASITTGGSTNAHLGVNQALDLHKNQDPNIGPGKIPINQDPALCGNMPQRLSANGPGALANDIISSINSNNPQNFAPNAAYPYAVYPNNFDNNSTAFANNLPPWSDDNNGYRNGWRAGNTIMIILTDGAIGNLTSYTASINALDDWETGVGANSFSGSTLGGSTLTRIAIGLNGSNQSQIEMFSRGNPGGSLNLSQDDNHHLTFPNVPPQTGLPTILNQILDSVINISFTNTNYVEYMELSLNRLLGSCLYNDVNFLEEVIPAILELQDPLNGNPDIKLSSIDLTGQSLLTYATLQNLIDFIPNFKNNIRSINLTGCVLMVGELIQDPNTLADGPLLKILKNANGGLVNLELTGCTGLSSNDIKTLVEDGVNSTNNSNCTLKYLAITGIDISSDLPAIFTQLGKNDTLEMLCAGKCEIDNNLFAAQALPNLIYSNTSNSSISTLKHIVLDENKITGAGLKAFVDAGVGANTLIGDLKRIFVQFQKTPVTGGPQAPPAGCSNIQTLPPNTIEPNDWLPFLIYDSNNNVTQGQYSDSEINDIEQQNSGFFTTDAVTGAITPIFAVNGKKANDYQAFAYIAGGYFNYQTFQQLASLPADWDDPSVFYINNSSCIPGKVIY